MNEQEVLKRLYIHNPWWERGKPAAKPEKTRYFYVLRNQELSPANKKIATIYGPRQVGKTELLKQLIAHLLDIGTSPNRILFVSLDDVLLGSNTDNIIADCLEAYSKNILQQPLQNSSKRIYAFLDEVQNVEGWSELLKNYYDLGYNIKFFVTGSSSIGIIKGLSESLVGRTTPYLVMPLKFSDFVAIKRPRMKNLDISLRAREKLAQAIQSKDLSALYAFLKGMRLQLAGDEDRLEALLSEYMVKGGYIGIAKESYAKSTRSLKDYIQLTIYNDIMKGFGIRNPREFDRLLALIASESSQRMAENRLSQKLHLKADTLSKYMDYLESVFLISSSPLYSKSRAKQIRNPKKIYISDVGIRNALIYPLGPELLKDGKEVGKIVETVVHSHLKRLWFLLFGDSASCFYGKNDDGTEVDNVLTHGKVALPIEVKYREIVDGKQKSSLHKFMGQNNARMGIIITKKTLALNKEKNILQIPLWMFLFLV